MTETDTNLPLDRLSRSLHDLRVSVTDRCNFRCVYCMPKAVFDKDYRFLPKSEILNYEQIVAVVRAAAELGVRKVRLTGGEPLVRHDVERLVAAIADVEGISDISLTTNASLLSARRASALKDAGLKRINVSLDALDDETFKRVNDVGISVAKVLEGIDNAAAAGFEAIKINMVVKQGLNAEDILPMARYFHGTGHILRFIEYMDVGNSNQWNLDEVVSEEDIVKTIGTEFALEPIAPNYAGEVARRYRYSDGGGEIGIITSVSHPFCGDCSRARLSTTGSLYTCLFSGVGHDIRPALAAGHQALKDQLRSIWERRGDRYSELRGQVVQFRPKVEMSFIGG